MGERVTVTTFRQLGLALFLSIGIGVEASGPPNLLLINVDDLDQNIGSLDYMPNLHRLLVQQGLTFPDFFVTNALCCPSRATLLRGQYTHSHEIVASEAPAGGFEKFLQMGHESSTLATWLDAAGYRTILLGKYLNGYPLRADRTHRPPGWHEWHSPADGTPYRGFDYRLNENGRLVSYGSSASDYLTDVLARKAESLLGRDVSKPFFLYIAPYAPHYPAPPAPRHQRLFRDARVPRTPSFNEEDVSDKPAPRSALGGSEIEEIDELYRSRLRSLQAVDELIARLLVLIERSGRLDNTYIFFTSDNGFHMGQHRLRPQKATPYEEDVRVPLIVRGPGVAMGEVVAGHLTGNVDLAPTLAELAGVEIPHFVEGRSLAPFLRGDYPAPTSWRQVFLLEQYSDEGLIAPSTGMSRPIFVALRTLRYKYVEYWTGVRELYDLETDPYELENRGDTAPMELVAPLSSALQALARCSGAGCRAAEAALPRVR
jgi:arylsulfatase A-like enzyme